MRSLLCAAQTVFLPVMNADPLCFWETRRLLEALGRLGITVPCVILNRLSRPNRACARCTERCRQEALNIEKAGELLGREPVVVPCLPAEPRGVALLERLGGRVLGVEADWPAEGPPAFQVPRLAAKLGGCPADLRRVLEAAPLVMVCGKGGVGKTTVASALALHLAEQCPSRVLLFSIDPAHSLSDAFGRPIGDSPTAVADRLDALEIGPEERLRQLRQTYRQEIGEFFDTLLSSEQMDARLDREAAERLVDLSPPGLDEVMALAELARYLRLGRHARFVIDTAPAGHFIQFLELPAVIRGWIRAFFEVFLKYGKFFRAPKFQTFLVDLSKAIRDVQAAMQQAFLLPVVTPHELSFEQTREFLDHMQRLGHSARLGVINHVTPAGGACAECSRRAAVSSRFMERYRQLYAGLTFLRLEEQQQSPTGVAHLSRIGHALFG
jgi:arsenite-transporting ATPase